MNSNITKEGIEVKPGQVWRDLDSRMNGGARTCTVIAVGDGYARMRVNGAHPYRETRVRVNRMHKGATGWALVSEGGAA